MDRPSLHKTTISVKLCIFAFLRVLKRARIKAFKNAEVQKKKVIARKTSLQIFSRILENQKIKAKNNFLVFTQQFLTICT